MATINLSPCMSMTPKMVFAHLSTNVSIQTPTTTVMMLSRRAMNRQRLVAVRAGPESKLSGKVEESIKNAEETCSDNPESGECAAAWDEVEEVSAAASHARDRQKESDPLENYCKDNPETDECRTYDN